ncbi:MAG: JAB domain-containing protein [Verrucomicrobiales bacterium]
MKQIEGVKGPLEYKVVALRECALPEEMFISDTPKTSWEYWKRCIEVHPQFNPECECVVVLLLNTRKRIKGHQLVSIGTLDSVSLHPREVFRTAIVAASSSIIIMHNHPSGEPHPSEADIRLTRELIKAGQLLKIELIDHIITGADRFCSLRELGFFYS